MLDIKTFVEGPIDANNYLVIDEESKEAVLIDCSSYRSDFIQAVKNSGAKLKYILLTHGHFDHILGVNAFKKEFDVEVYMAKEDIPQIELAPQMMSIFTGSTTSDTCKIDSFIKDGDELKIGNTLIKAISTPGHTEGGMCYLIENKLFSGDTVFQGSVGRCDMPGGDLDTIIKSIKEKLFVMSDEIDVYPGHGPKTTIGFEKKYNEIVNL